MKMYTGAETSKETQHISPHIAAHKSSLAPTSSATTLSSLALSGSGGSQHLAQSHLPSHKIGLCGHIPTYRVGIHASHQSIVKGLDHDGPLLLSRHGHTNLSSHFSKSIPQDLSAHSAAGAEKAVPLELTPHTSSHHKSLSHIQATVSQGMSSNPVGTHMSAHQADRGSPYYRVPDSVLNVQGPSAMLVSSVGGDGGVSSLHHNSQTNTLVHSQSNLSAQSSTANLTTMPGVSLPGVNPAIVTSVCSQSSIQPSECVMTPIMSSACGVHQANVKKEKNERLDEMKISAGQGGDGSQQTIGPQRDLVRQALQAVVTHPQHKTELLMMNIQVNASLQAMNKNPSQPDTESEQVVDLQPAAVDETNSLQSEPSTPKRRRPRLSDEAQAERRIRIALRMREKRAGETEEQKRLRRIREAERMRRKRSSEDEVQKLKRRQEAAIRARNRRASMSPEERLIDRQKAADRMRLRRATESDEQKAIRRLKAAERMRKRRASETPEQRAEVPEPLPLQKHVVSQESSPAPTPTPVSTTHTNMTTSLQSHIEPLSLHKATNYHHHLPHLLHYHQHHTSSLQQQQNPHQHMQQRHHQQ